MCISINFVFANKSNMYSRNVLFEKYFDCPVFKLSAPNSYCCNFNGRAVPWAFPLEFVCKSKVESRVESSAWLTERKTRPVISDFIYSLMTKAERSDKKHNRFYMSQSGNVSLQSHRRLSMLSVTHLRSIPLFFLLPVLQEFHFLVFRILSFPLLSFNISFLSCFLLFLEF